MRDLSLPTICAWCNRIRCKSGEWTPTDSAELHLSPATHGICPDCLERATAHATLALARRQAEPA